jgi:hypothetical protein
MKENDHSNAAFGNTKAAFVLFEKLQSDPRLSRRVTNLVCNFNKQINAISTLDTSVGLGIAKLVYSSTVELLKKLPENVSSYTINVVKAKYRKFMWDNNGMLPEGIRNRPKIGQFDLNQNLIKEFVSLHQIKRELGYSRSKIKCVLKGDLQEVFGFIWKYTK